MEDKPSRGGGGPGGPKPKRRCRYGSECRNIGRGCKFHHPSSAEEGGDEKKSKPKSPAGEKNAAPKPKRDKSKIQCRYGMECRNTKCPFFHHPAAAPVACTKSPSRVLSPDNVADVSNEKTSPSSPPNFMHNGQSERKSNENYTAEQSPTLHSNGKSITGTTSSRKAYTKKKCRWGSGCRNKRCTFLHPGQQFDRDAVPGPSASGSARTAAAATESYLAEKESTRSAAQSILPPSVNRQSAAYARGLLFPPSEGKASFEPHPTQAPEAMSHFNNVFSSVPDAPASGISDDQGRTPLYSKSSSAFVRPNSDNGGDRVRQSTGQTADEDQAADHSQHKPPDADWLFEVLGLNRIIDDAEETQPPQFVAEEDTAEQAGTSSNIIEDNVEYVDVNEDFESAAPVDQIPTPSKEAHVDANEIPEISVGESPSKKVVPEDEIVQSRRAALELRFECQQNPSNSDLLSNLLQTCRIKQGMIKTALERSMSNEGGTDDEFDETNVEALFELNDLLVGAIDMADLALRAPKKNTGEKRGSNTGKATATKSSNPKAANGSKKKDESSWKPVEKKAATAAAAKKATKKSKTAEEPEKSKKKKKSAKPSKVETHKQEETKLPAVSPKSESPATDSDPKPDPAQVAIDAARQEKERMARKLEEARKEAAAMDAARQEKERMARMLENARKEAAAARERKKSKKNKKHERWLKQNEEAKENRAKSWAERIAKENDYMDLMQKLLVAEFSRQMTGKTMGLSTERVLSDTQASEVITKECREAYRVIFGGPKCRVVVAGSDNKDMNGRNGTIRYYDREKEKYCVGLDTKKLGPDSDVQFLIPNILEALTSQRPKSDKKTSATSYDVDAPDFISYGGVSLGFSFTLKKSHVVALGSAESTKVGLEVFSKTRDAEDRQQKMEEEAEKRREEEDSKRRAARKAQEEAKRQQRKEQMRKDKEAYEKMKREYERERSGFGFGFGRSMFDFMDDDDEEEDDEDCQCPRCRYGRSNNFSRSGGSFFFSFGGIPFRVRFGGEDSDYSDEDFDERWEEQLEEEREEENRKQAEVLGVDADADARTIKLAYRKMALQFHPDKWKSDSEHGMSREDAENRFKSIQNAYDHLLSNFDD